MRSTGRIPIVMVGVSDPRGAGFVQTLSHPGGNITGVSNISRDLSGKILALLKEVVPGATRVGVLRNPGNPAARLQLGETERAAHSMGVRLWVSDVREPRQLEEAFAVMRRERVAGVTALADPLFVSERKQIAELALRARLPTAFARRENVDAGGLVSYGPNLARQFRRAADYVHRIFQGATPGDLPVEEPTLLELIVNQRTAKALGLTIPPSLLQRADQVIE
jgi:putative ABC transport system substrate-binding protein